MLTMLFNGSELFLPFMDQDGDNGGGDVGADKDVKSNANDTNGNKDGKVFTQDELNRIVAERLSKERKKYEGFDDLKARLAEYEAAEEERKKAAMTEQERLLAEKEEAERKAAEAEEASKKALEEANKRLINAEFRLAAKEAGINPDAIDDAFKLADLSGVTVGDNAKVEGIEDVVKSLLESKPYLRGQPQVKPEPKRIGEGTQSGSKDSDKTREQLLKEAMEKASKSGRIEDRIAYAKLKLELEG